MINSTNLTKIDDVIKCIFQRDFAMRQDVLAMSSVHDRWHTLILPINTSDIGWIMHRHYYTSGERKGPTTYHLSISFFCNFVSFLLKFNDCHSTFIYDATVIKLVFLKKNGFFFCFELRQYCVHCHIVNLRVWQCVDYSYGKF